MKKTVLSGMALCFILCGCGNVTQVRIPETFDSLLYSDAEIKDACKTVRSLFSEFR